ncbi:hypothetical protein MMC34_006433 [Xylographa carneopallida]|nr:hypothetical protein [Xylographa carneopallida]
MASRDSIERSSSEFGGSGVPPLDVETRATDSVAGLDGVDRKSSTTDSSAIFDNVLRSDIGLSTLLARLKQSIGSARDFAAFLRKRSALEEEHAQGLKKLCRTTHDTTRRPESRQGSYSRSFDEITQIHDSMADNGIQFALSLHQMHEDLQELATDKERGRKQWKQTGLSAEKRVQDSEAAMEKAKTKYNSLSEDYDRARTGDKQTGRFGLKGPKSAAQVEEDLHRKVQAADTDYASKVQTAQGLRRELVSTSRPQTAQALQQLIKECDSGLTLQMQKFASFNEKLLLSNGLRVSPLKSQSDTTGTQPRSLRDVVYEVNNERDLRDYVTSRAPRVHQRQGEVQYEPHHSLQSAQQAFPPPTNRQTSIQTLVQSFPGSSDLHSQNPHMQGINLHQSPVPSYVPVIGGPNANDHDSPKQPTFSSSTASGPPQVPPPQFSAAQSQFPSTPLNPPSMLVQLPHSQSPMQKPMPQIGIYPAEMPPLRPVFGVSLEDLFNRDGSAVPMVVYQCLQAVDLFGLEVEGIYRLSGTASHIGKLRTIFDNDASQADFRNPENFFHDVNSVAGLLKQFFRDLPNPLLTREHYQGFIEAARIDDDVARRDSLHATINNLPDPNYATLRALTLHLHRVQEHSPANRMNAGNLAICFGPTLMGTNNTGNIADAGWQVRVIDTILQNTYQIFDDD